MDTNTPAQARAIERQLAELARLNAIPWPKLTMLQYYDLCAVIRWLHKNAPNFKAPNSPTSAYPRPPKG